jgi:hypothetical protein
MTNAEVVRGIPDARAVDVERPHELGTARAPRPRWGHRGSVRLSVPCCEPGGRGGVRLRLRWTAYMMI